jgi:uncharacterized protein (TIGR02145 family)
MTQDTKQLNINHLPDLLTLKEVATILRVSPLTVKRWGARGKFPAIRINSRGDRRYKKEAVLFLLGYELERQTMKIKTGKYTDPRDGKTYTIALMPDGKYWFTQNLAYNPKKKGHYKKGCDHYYTWELAQKVAPKGWKLPSKDDFVALDKAVGGTGWYQKPGSDFWRPDGDFRGLYSGYVHYDGSFLSQGSYGWWWSSSKYSSECSAYNMGVSPSSVNPHRYNYKVSGFAVRLVSDTLPKGAVMDEEEKAAKNQKKGKKNDS